MEMTMNVAVLPEGRCPSFAQFLIDEIRGRAFAQPTLVMSLDAVRFQYRALSQGLGRAHIHYAVKANPHPEVLTALLQEGSRFDAASRGEIEQCLALGARPEHISFGNTIKRPTDIAFAYQAGLRLFAFDAEQELEKIAEMRLVHRFICGCWLARQGRIG